MIRGCFSSSIIMKTARVDSLAPAIRRTITSKSQSVQIENAWTIAVRGIHRCNNMQYNPGSEKIGGWFVHDHLAKLDRLYRRNTDLTIMIDQRWPTFVWNVYIRCVCVYIYIHTHIMSQPRDPSLRLSGWNKNNFAGQCSGRSVESMIKPSGTAWVMSTPDS